MQLDLIVVGPLQVNCYIISDTETSSGIIIDPGWDVPEIVKFIKKRDLKDITILCTHGHFDHISGVPELREATGAKAYLNKEDYFFIPSVNGQTAMSCMMGGIDPFEFDGEINEGDEFTVGNVTLRALATPGHSPGGISFYDGQGKVIVGDCLFQGSVGRVDLPKSNGQDLLNSINDKLYALPDSTVVFCGHGPDTSIGQEKMSNPFTNNPGLLLH